MLESCNANDFYFKKFFGAQYLIIWIVLKFISVIIPTYTLINRKIKISKLEHSLDKTHCASDSFTNRVELSQKSFPWVNNEYNTKS